MFTKLNTELAGRMKFVPSEAEIYLLNQALDAAAQSVQRFRVGAASCVGSAYNTKELHAESHMILSRVGDACVQNATVAVARLGRKHDWRCSYPCPSCANQLRNKGFTRLVCFNEHGQPVSLSLV